MAVQLYVSRVSDVLAAVTVIVPTRPAQSEIAAVDAARALDYPQDKLEIIVARGKQPAVQRNKALAAASGELIYFLDDDSKPTADNLHRAAKHFANPAIAMVGGPNLCPDDAPPLEKVFSVVLGSWALAASRSRYDRIGATRETSEKELILCNLLARRSVLQELGGFDEALYPNEENALMDDIQKRGGKLIYDPDLVVYRRPRPTLKAFIKMLLNYGRGRAEQFRLHPTFGSALNFVPPGFCVYLAIAPWFGGVALLPLAVYGLAVAGQVLVLIPRKGLYAIGAAPLIVLTHIFYGLGFWRGLFTRLNKSGSIPPTEVTLEKVK